MHNNPYALKLVQDKQNGLNTIMENFDTLKEYYKICKSAK